MPKLGAEPIRKAALINAAIDQVGSAGTLDVTVAQIARAAGVSPALAHHYFGSKDQIFLAAMRHIMSNFGESVLLGLPGTSGRRRLAVIVSASFGAPNFRHEVVSAWLNFYALSLVNDEAARLLKVYHRRLRSNLIVALRPVSDRPEAVAETLGALIDGVYLRAALSHAPTNGFAAVRMVNDYLDEVLT
ncbi:transcriptional regulator BetI [Paracoccus sp. TK19116]|uniref:HTH-type transcriptional regulator BetI n=1 Tax=Paracoccus albicereus TaxID=2922394 RepID=A0ABT1MUT6_9RHOB|nr:transcriptional regulator BetI [Paracoccus albicereus]MCQ0971226.1 transcriptional regulator BetI [Paracoccus albicereus]